MAMLAEPRRKQKWSVDPRNSAWSKDESKFGQKMLERMGWSKGKGLGKSEQGATEHIKVKVKNNNLGLGTTVNNEDNWIAHQDDFNQLLAELNNCHGQNNEEPTQENFSLEEKSKTSKKRVHYMKFTKGKDLSNRSETDLACVFGKRLKQTSDQDESSNGRDSQEEREQDSSEQDGPAHPEEELHTVTSALTMQEYFAQRMARLKGGGQSLSAASSSGPTPASTDPSPNASDAEESKKKKKRKKRKVAHQEVASGEDEEKMEEAEEHQVMEEMVDEDQGDLEREEKKKKKKKKKKDRAGAFGIPTAEEDAARDTETFSPDKRKSKRKDNGRPHTSPDSASEHDAVGIVMDRQRSDKKRKRRDQVEEQADVEERKPKTVKRKHR
ncbi:PIN2/TERF1-interacting telomerase inhibitor 1 [Brachyhypopomus gauderio]|uniref:PIN2/TERF1-interacting telomerase inhibitor 1 n=1 Tax=Brachyhypopomus gauderio TaxID=698409 RepID=UPI00404116EA